MKETLSMTLERPARKKGGDRYTTKYDEEDLVIYFPQSISRQNSVDGSPLKKLQVTIEDATGS